MNLKLVWNTSSVSETFWQNEEMMVSWSAHIHIPPLEKHMWIHHYHTRYLSAVYKAYIFSFLSACSVLTSQHTLLNCTWGSATGLHHSVSRLINHYLSSGLPEEMPSFFTCVHTVFFICLRNSYSTLPYSFCVRWLLLPTTGHEELSTFS